MTTLYVLLGFIGLLLIITSLLPKKYEVSKSIEIDASPIAIFPLVADLNNYSKWNPWQKTDTTSTLKIEGRPKEVGHKYSWSGKKVGIGSLTTKEVKDMFYVNFDLNFAKPFKSEAKDCWTFDYNDDHKTKVVWKNNGELPFGVARLMGPFIKLNLNKQFTKGLTSIKKLAEQA